MKKSKILFISATMVFIIAMLFAVVQMQNQTTPPWERKKLQKFKKADSISRREQLNRQKELNNNSLN